MVSLAQLSVVKSDSLRAWRRQILHANAVRQNTANVMKVHSVSVLSAQTKRLRLLIKGMVLTFTPARK